MVAIWPATFLQGPGAATGIALINTIGSFGKPASHSSGLSMFKQCIQDSLCSLKKALHAVEVVPACLEAALTNTALP